MDKIQENISLKDDTKCNKYTPHRSDRAHKKHANMHTDSLGSIAMSISSIIQSLVEMPL